MNKNIFFVKFYFNVVKVKKEENDIVLWNWEEKLEIIVRYIYIYISINLIY